MDRIREIGESAYQGYKNPLCGWMNHFTSVTKSQKIQPVTPVDNLIFNQLPDFPRYSTFVPFFAVMMILLLVVALARTLAFLFTIKLIGACEVEGKFSLGACVDLPGS